MKLRIAKIIIGLLGVGVLGAGAYLLAPPLALIVLGLALVALIVGKD